jgi:hypothetical protein
MSNTKLRIRVGHILSDYFAIDLGVGQGNPLSTFLFDVFIDDLLELLAARPQTTKIGINTDGTLMADLTYADDVNAASWSAAGLQSHIWMPFPLGSASGGHHQTSRSLRAW